MAIYTIPLTIADSGVRIMHGCSTKFLIEEQANAIANALKEVELTIDVDDDWGIVTITHVNGREVASE